MTKGSRQNQWRGLAGGMTKVIGTAITTHSYAALAQTPQVGLDTTIEHVAPWPPWFTLLLLAATAILILKLYLYERTDRDWIKYGLAALRFTLFCLVIWMMYGLNRQSYRTDLPDLLVVVDNSESMSTVDPSTEADETTELDARLDALSLLPASRLNRAKCILLADDRALLKSLETRFQTRLVTLDAPSANAGEDAVRALEAKLDESRLGGALSDALQRQRGRPVAAVVYFTDGKTTTGPPLSEVAYEAQQRSIPLHIVGLGSQQPALDLRLGELVYDDVVFAGDLVTFDFTLAADGFANQQIEVSLQRNDGVGETVTQQIELSEDREALPIRLSYRVQEAGSYDFSIQVESRPGEVSSSNNQLQATVEVRDERTRVLLVQSYPSYEFHYLKTLLERSRADDIELDTMRDATTTMPNNMVELDVVLQEADPEFAVTDASAIADFPTRDELFEYDVCIFGDVNPAFLGSHALTDLRDFVQQRGRGLIAIAGPRYFPAAYQNTALAEILPFTIGNAIAPPPDLPIQTGFRALLTPLGDQVPFTQLGPNLRSNKTIWAELPDLYWLLEVDALKPGVRVLSTHPRRTSTAGNPLPVSTLSYVGAGKVLFHYTDDSWRWRIGRGDEYFGRYWRQAIRYLCRFKLGEGRNVELSTDRETYNRGEVVRLRARYFDERLAPEANAGVTVMLEHEGRGERQLKLEREQFGRGTFSTNITNLNSGKYHAWIVEPKREGESPAVDFEIATMNSEMTNVQMDITDLKRAADASGGKFYTFETASTLIDELPMGRQVRIEPLPPDPIWNSWWVALVFLGVLVSEWLLRRRLGMT